MSSFYSQNELQEIGFKHCGKNVRLSRKTSIYGAENISIGDNCRIDDFCILSGKLSIGNYIHLAVYDALFGGDAGIVFEDHSGLSSRVTVYAASDDFSGQAYGNAATPIEFRYITEKSVIFKRHSLIGASCVVLPGVVVEEGTAVGAMSLVNRSTKPWTIYGGNPLKELKPRSRNILKLEKEFLKKYGGIVDA